MASSVTTGNGTDGAVPVRGKRVLFRNSLAVVPLRIFLGCAFVFAGFAKLTYPGFLDPNSNTGFRAILVGIKAGSPIGGMLQPMIDHANLFGHLTAFSEIAIGLGLVVGLLTRLAALGGIALTTMIALSVNWSSIKQYTGSYGWYTSVDIAFAVALFIFVLGGSGPLSLDRLFWWNRARRRGIEPSDGYHQPSVDESMARLRGDWDDTYPTAAQAPVSGTGAYGEGRYDEGRYDEGRYDEGRYEERRDAEPRPDRDEPTQLIPRVDSESGAEESGEHETRTITDTDVRSANTLAEDYPTQEHARLDARIDEGDLIDEHEDLPPAPGV